MRAAITLAVLGLLAISFWSGYTYSEQRLATGIVELQRACNLSVAETTLRVLDVIKDKGPERAEEGLMLVAKASATDSTHELIRVGWSVPSFGTDQAVAFLRERNDARYASLQERLARSR